MIVACGLDYKMLDEELQLEVIRTVRQHLLIPKGLRTLSPRNLLYKGSQEGGSPAERDFAGKNGSAWPWLLQFYVKACFDIDGDAFLPQAREILANFDEDIQSYGIGSICELYDADPPYASRGAISQAWSVGAVLNIHSMIRERTKEEARESNTAGKAAKAVKPVAKSTAKKAAVKKTATDNTPKKTAAVTGGKSCQGGIPGRPDLQPRLVAVSRDVPVRGKVKIAKQGYSYESFNVRLGVPAPHRGWFGNGMLRDDPRAGTQRCRRNIRSTPCLRRRGSAIHARPECQ